ncbi:MAG: hypothetical protein QOJ55_223 [Solirubrobacteraceae bacterium]|nr:hypothetical protein [Solirubrobacteraceae bacterium]
MMRIRNQRGFTLIETLVAATLSIIVLTAVLGAFEAFHTHSQKERLRADAQDRARGAVDLMARSLRNGAGSAAGGGVLERAGAYDLIFKTVDATGGAQGANTNGLMRARYCVDASDPSHEAVWMQTQRWTTATPPSAPTALPCPGTGWDANQQQVLNAVNVIGGQSRPLFTFSPVSWAAPSDIAGVGIDLVVDVKPGSRPGESRLQSTVSLRNLNRSPTARLTCTPGSNGHAVCDGSASADADGQVLSYTWAMDGSPVLGATGYRLDQGNLASGTTHTFTLTVTDPGGLSNTQTQTVPMP